jgi:CRP-like cAMP-binding protein
MLTPPPGHWPKRRSSASSSPGSCATSTAAPSAAARRCSRRAIRAIRLFGLISGQLKLSSAASGPREVALALVAPGELVGELGAILGGPRWASAVALAHSELATISHGSLAALFDAQPELRSRLNEAASRTALRLAQRAEDVACLSIENRLEKALDDLARRFGESVERGIRIPLRQRDLADVLGVSRESVNRLLSSASMRDRLELGRGSILLRAS